MRLSLTRVKNIELTSRDVLSLLGIPRSEDWFMIERLRVRFLFANTSSSLDMTRTLICLTCVLIVCFASGIVSAQHADFDIDLTTRLLKSNKISELREAHAIVKSHPSESLVLLSAVAARAEHPELAMILKSMFRSLPTDRLRTHLANGGSTKSRLAASELKSRGEPTQPPSSTPRQVRTPASTTRSKPTPTTKPEPLKAGIASLQPTVISLSSIQEKQKQNKPLQESELIYLLQELDTHFKAGSPEEYRFRNDIKPLLRRNYKSLDEIASKRLLDDSVKHPERLCEFLIESLTQEQKVRERVYTLSLSDDEDCASQAIRCFQNLGRGRPPNAEIMNEIVSRFLKRNGKGEKTRGAIDSVLADLSRWTSAPIKLEIRQRLLESALHPHSKYAITRYRSSAEVQRLLSVAKALPEDERKRIGVAIILRFEEAEAPAQATHLLLSLNANMAGIQPTFRKLLESSESTSFQALYAQALYRSGDHGESVVNAFRDALSQTSSAAECHFVLQCMQELGADAAPVLPLILDRLDDPRVYKPIVCAVIASMGEAAKDATPKLIELLEPSSRSFGEQREIVRALGEIGSIAKDALPKLRDIAVVGNSNLTVVTYDAILKILGTDPAGVDFLTQLSLSAKTPRAAWYAAAAAEKLRRKTTTIEQRRDRYVDRGEYVEDTLTGLLWQKDGDASGRKNFDQAEQYAAELVLADMTNWRLPHGYELASIFPATEIPFIDTLYTEVSSSAFYWSSHRVGDRSRNYAYLACWYGEGHMSGVIANANRCLVRCVHDPVTPKGR